MFPIAGLLMPGLAIAQGQDSTLGERNLLIIAELLPGTYDNVNQNYFDKRRKLPEPARHARVETVVERVESSKPGEKSGGQSVGHVFVWTERVGTGADQRTSRHRVTLTAGPADDEVTMRVQDVQNDQGGQSAQSEACAYSFRRRADHFHGVQKSGACKQANEMQLSRTSLWLAHPVGGTAAARDEPFWLERARTFHCYVDVPGVGGGRDIPFQRYDAITLHDKGGAHWFKTRESRPRELGISLQAVTWHVLNERNGNFNRNSLVLYVMERAADGAVTEHGYSFTEPDADRIGINLKWMLANCAMTARDEARPEM